LTQHQDTTLLSTSLTHDSRPQTAAAAAAAHVRRVCSLSTASPIGRADGWAY